MTIWILAALTGALVLDRIVGDPPALWARLPHPVVLFGHGIAFFDRRLNRETLAPATRRRNGCDGGTAHDKKCRRGCHQRSGRDCESARQQRRRSRSDRLKPQRVHHMVVVVIDAGEHAEWSPGLLREYDGPGFVGP